TPPPALPPPPRRAAPPRSRGTPPRTGPGATACPAPTARTPAPPPSAPARSASAAPPAARPPLPRAAAPAPGTPRQPPRRLSPPSLRQRLHPAAVLSLDQPLDSQLRLLQQPLRFPDVRHAFLEQRQRLLELQPLALQPAQNPLQPL